MVEAVWHILISFMRPRWEWTSTMVTVFGFVLQDIVRVGMLGLSILAWRALKRGEQAVGELRAFFRGLLVLFVFEMLEISLKFTEVHGICNAPEVWERRLRRNSTLSEGSCEVIANLYDYGWGIIVLIILASVLRMTHAHLTSLGGATWRQREHERQQQQSQQQQQQQHTSSQQQHGLPAATDVAEAADVELGVDVEPKQ